MVYIPPFVHLSQFPTHVRDRLLKGYGYIGVTRRFEKAISDVGWQWLVGGVEEKEDTYLAEAKSSLLLRATSGDLQ